MLNSWVAHYQIGLGLLLALAVLVWLPRRNIDGRAWALLRSIVPAWRFFEQIEPLPRLLYRVATPTAADFGDWFDALPPPARDAASLLLNARGNLHLACQSLVEHLEAELESDAARDLESVERLVSYRLVQALIEGRVRELGTPNASRYQFCLSWPGDEAEFVSGVHAV